jgi:hypothetical protein
MCSGIYSLQYHTCNLSYIGQTGRCLAQRYEEYIRYITSNKPKSAYALHILHNKREYGRMEATMFLLHPVHKGRQINLL